MFYKTIALVTSLAFGLVANSGVKSRAPVVANKPSAPVNSSAAATKEPPPPATPVNPQMAQRSPLDPFKGWATPPGYPRGSWASSAGSYDDEDQFATPPEEEEPTPQNPVQKVYEDGKIVVIVGNERHFGYRIGSRIPLTIVVASDNDVKLDFTAITKGIFGLDGSDFEMAAPAVIQVLGQAQGKIFYRVDLVLRTFVMKPGIAFTADILYATHMTPDGKSPDWQRLTTPDFIVSRSATADNGENLLEGDMSEASYQISWFTYPLLLAGLSLILLWPMLIIVKWLQRVHPLRQAPANELAWQTFDRVITEGKKNGFTVQHYKKIASALRKYLGIESQTLSETEVILQEHSNSKSIHSALSKFDSVLYDVGFLNESELEELYDELEELVPRP